MADDGERPRQRDDLVVPHSRVEVAAVQKNNNGTGPGALEVQARAVHFGDPRVCLAE